MYNIRRATEKDTEAIKALCHKFNRRLPSEIWRSIVCVDEHDTIIGFANVAPKLFIDPLVMDEDRLPIERIKIVDALAQGISGMVSTTDAHYVYYTADGDFADFLDKRFNSELFTNELTYRIKV